MKVETIIGIIVLCVLCISSIQGGPDESAKKAYDEVWQGVLKGLRIMVKDIELHCEAKNKRFDSLKMEEELEKCMGDKIKTMLNPFSVMNPFQSKEIQLALKNVKTGRTLRPDQITLIWDEVTKPLCAFLHEYFRCAKPQRSYLIDLCMEGSGIVSKAYEYADILVLSVCKQNGKQMMDFIEADGLSCVDHFIEGENACLLRFTVEESLATKPKSTLELCNEVEILHNCFDSGLDTCPKKKPVEIIRSIFKEAKTWVKTSCMKDSAESIQHFSFILYVLISFIPYFGLRV